MCLRFINFMYPCTFFDFIKLEFKDETLKLLSCLPQRSVHTHTCRLMSGLYSQVVKIKCAKYLPYWTSTKSPLHFCEFKGKYTVCRIFVILKCFTKGQTFIKILLETLYKQPIVWPTYIKSSRYRSGAGVTIHGKHWRKTVISLMFCGENHCIGRGEQPGRLALTEGSLR